MLGTDTFEVVTGKIMKQYNVHTTNNVSNFDAMYRQVSSMCVTLTQAAARTIEFSYTLLSYPRTYSHQHVRPHFCTLRDKLARTIRTPSREHVDYGTTAGNERQTHLGQRISRACQRCRSNRLTEHFVSVLDTMFLRTEQDGSYMTSRLNSTRNL